MDINNSVAKKILYTLMGHMPIGTYYLVSEYSFEQASGFIQKKGLTSERPDYGLVLVPPVFYYYHLRVVVSEREL